MKRQIKFRAWDSIRMTTSGIMFNCSTGELCTPEGANMKLMQFTGLQDINGKDIYEGDIVNICGGFGYLKNMEGVNATYIVSFKTCEYLLFRHDIKLTWGRLSRLEEMNYNCEIIGNIYENPELLKTTENE